MIQLSSDALRRGLSPERTNKSWRLDTTEKQKQKSSYQTANKLIWETIENTWLLKREIKVVRDASAGLGVYVRFSRHHAFNSQQDVFVSNDVYTQKMSKRGEKMRNMKYSTAIAVMCVFHMDSKSLKHEPRQIQGEKLSTEIESQ